MPVSLCTGVAWRRRRFWNERKQKRILWRRDHDIETTDVLFHKQNQIATITITHGQNHAADRRNPDNGRSPVRYKAPETILP